MKYDNIMTDFIQCNLQYTFWTSLGVNGNICKRIIFKQFSVVFLNIMQIMTKIYTAHGYIQPSLLQNTCSRTRHVNI